MPAYLKPSTMISRVMNPLLVVFGAKPALATRGRRTGEWHTVPVNVAEVGGQRYLVAPRGDTHWARNLRHDPAGELRHRGRVERFRAEEVPVDARAPIIAAYRQRWDSEVAGLFARLPDPADHPVFKIEPAT